MATIVRRQPGMQLASRRSKIVFTLCTLAIVALAVESSVEAALGGNKLLLVVPLGAFIGLGLFVLGLVNFENFVFTTIAIRASLDITKTGAGNGGASGVNSGTASAPGLDPTGALAILFILVAFFWMLTRMREGRKSPPMSIHRVCLILFALAGFLSVIDSASPSISLLEAIRITAVVTMLAVLEVMLVNREMIQKLIASIYISAIIPVGYTLFNVVIHHSQFTSGGVSRFEGTFSQPNPFAIYLTLLIIMGVALLPHLEPKKQIAMSVHSQRMDRDPAWRVRRRTPGQAAHDACGLGRGSHGLARGVSDDPAAFRGSGHVHKRRRLRIELVVLAIRLLGRGAPAREQGSDHRHRPGHELVGNESAEGTAQRLPALVR
jgi:hypothetical protein